MMPSYLPPLLVFIAALLAAFALNRAAISRHPNKDSGALWTRVLAWSGGLLAPLQV